MGFVERSFQELSFAEVLIAIIIAWILVSLWLRVIENLAFNTLALDPESSYHALIVAVTVTIIFIAFTFSVNSVISGVIVGDTFSIAPSPPESPFSSSLTIASEQASSGNSTIKASIMSNSPYNGTEVTKPRRRERQN